MKRLFPKAFVLFMVCGLSFIGCKKEQLEEKKTQVESIDQITEESENSGGGIDEKEEDGKADGAENDIKKEDEIFRKLTNGVLRGEKEISVVEFLISTEKADSIYKQFLINNPLLFHLSIMGNMGYRTDWENPEYLSVFIPRYSMPMDYFQQIYPFMEDGLEQYYSLLDYRMTSAEIAYTLYQNLCEEVVYKERSYEYPFSAHSAFSALGAFLSQKAVCQGYSLSYSLLLNALGIETDYVTGAVPGTSGHVWNRIYIDGEWYHADATFDDAGTRHINSMYSINRYFLTSDYLFYTVFEHGKPHSNLQKRIYLQSGTKFDDERCVVRRYDAKGNIIKTEAMYADGYWYYLSMKEEKMKILKSDFEGRQVQEIRQLNLLSSIGNVDKVQYTKDRIYFLDLINGKYYICSMNYDGNDFKQERKISFIEASSNGLKLSADTSRPVHAFKGKVALRAELALAQLKLLYFHGDDDYFHLSHPQAQELEQLIKTAVVSLEKNQVDDVQAEAMSQELRNKRKTYSLPLSVRP